MSSRDLLLALLIPLIWGSVYVFLKSGMAEIPPVALCAGRFLFVALCVCPFFARPKNLKIYAILGTCMALEVGTLFVGLSYEGAGTVAALIQLAVPLTFLFGLLFFKETVKPIAWAGALVSLFGVWLIQGSPDVTSLLGVSFALISAFGWAISTIWGRWMKDESDVMMVAWGSLFAGLILLPFSLYFEPPSSWIGGVGSLGISALIFSAIFSVGVGFGLWYFLIGRYPVRYIAPFSLLSPVFSLIGGAMVHGEGLGAQKLTGILCALLGVAVVLMVDKKVEPEIVRDA